MNGSRVRRNFCWGHCPEKHNTRHVWVRERESLAMHTYAAFWTDAKNLDRPEKKKRRERNASEHCVILEKGEEEGGGGRDPKEWKLGWVWQTFTFFPRPFGSNQRINWHDELRNPLAMNWKTNLTKKFGFFPELLVSMPLTVFLPSLVLRRSLMLEEEEEEMLLSTPSSSNSSSSSLPTTSLERIFETLGIDSLECQKRFICEAMETPKRFEPLSNIIYILLRWKSKSRFNWI